MFISKKLLFGQRGMNIQLFAAGDHVNLTEGEQARYVNTIMRKLGRPNSLPLQTYMAKSQSQNAAYSLFYVGGSIKARDRQANRNDTNNNFDDVKGVKAGQIITSIRVTPTEMEVPVWVDNRDFDKSQLNEEGAITDMQVTAIYEECDRRITTLFKDIITNKKRTVKNSNNKDIEIAVPESNFFGDGTKPFAEQVKEFKRMMRRAKKLAKADGKRIGIVAGEEGTTELTDCEKFTKKDWVTVNGETPNQTGDPLDKLCGGYVEELWTFDEVFYTGEETVGYMVVVIEGAFGQDNKKMSINPIIDYVKWKKAYYMDVEVANATELLQGAGFLVFQYKRDVGTAASAMLSNTPVAMKAANDSNTIDYEKAIELEKIKAANLEKELEIARLKHTQQESPETEAKPKTVKKTVTKDTDNTGTTE